jgi:hypothetical protein
MSKLVNRLVVDWLLEIHPRKSIFGGKAVAVALDGNALPFR